VTLNGDNLAVGAINEDSSATGIGGDQSNNDVNSAGAVYVFSRSGSIWSQQTYVKSSNTGSDLFGSAITMDGNTLAVGAVTEDSSATGVGGNQGANSATNAGAVYVFDMAAGINN